MLSQNDNSEFQISNADLSFAEKIAAQVYHEHAKGYICPEDTRQIAYLALLESKKRYRNSGNATFHTFAYLRIRGAIFDELRRCSRHRIQGSKSARSDDDQNHSCTEIPNEISVQSLTPEDICHRNHLRRLLSSLIERLSPNSKDIINSLYFYEQTKDEIATRHKKFSKSWFSRAHTDALQNLRSALLSEFCSKEMRSRSERTSQHPS